MDKKGKKQQQTIKRDDDTCFQYAATIALNHRKNQSHPEKFSDLKPFIDNFN